MTGLVSSKVKEFSSVYAAFQFNVERWQDRAFLRVLEETSKIYGVDAGDISYRDLAKSVENTRLGYVEKGYSKGLRVGLMLENRPAFFIHWFALNALGISVVPLNADFKISELSYLIEHSEIVLAVAIESKLDLIVQSSRVVGVELSVMKPDDMPPLCKAISKNDSYEIDLETECALLYTSGTTGMPKGCILTNQYFITAGRWYAGIGGLAKIEPGQECMLTPLPLVHMNAMAYSMMCMMMTGGTLCLLDRFHPETWWKSVTDSQASIVHYLGVMSSILMKIPVSPDETNHRVRFGFGAGVEKTLHADFEKRFGFPLIEAWAMTETGAGAVIIANHDPRHVGTSCFGQELPAVEVSLIDEEGRPVETGQPGELLVRHSGSNPKLGFFAGYLKDEAATHEVWRNGWFHTGDIVLRDESGSLHFIDRRKNVIRRSGENISAVEVESVLLKNPNVKAVGVTSVPDAIRGEEVMACIVPVDENLKQDQHHLLATELSQWALKQISYHKVPGWYVFVEHLPLTTSQKIQRANLKELANNSIATSKAIDLKGLKKRQEA
jgi:acyl-CoA synthetase (AMP-forming)/AMP-acid ligase II